MDAIALLKKDHAAVKVLFEKFEVAGDDEQTRQSLFDQIDAQLDVHAAIEEQIFYPAVQEVRSEETKDMVLEQTEVETPLEVTLADRIPGKKIAVCPILRAGMGMLDGVLSLIPVARVGFIGLYRNEETLQPVEYYVKLPADVADRDVILLDPMLATGNSTAHAVKLVKDAGATSVRLISIIAAPEGIENIQQQHPDVQIVVAAIDRGLNEKGYIVPGLGDAGDRLYGTK